VKWREWEREERRQERFEEEEEEEHCQTGVHPGVHPGVLAVGAGPACEEASSGGLGDGRRGLAGEPFRAFPSGGREAWAGLARHCQGEGRGDACPWVRRVAYRQVAWEEHQEDGRREEPFPLAACPSGAFPLEVQAFQEEEDEGDRPSAKAGGQQGRSA